MRKIAMGVAALIALGAAGVAQAGPGRCYDAYGRPIGPVYNTDSPNYGWINSVLAQGGSCTGVVSPGNPGGYYYSQPQYYDHGYYSRRTPSVYDPRVPRGTYAPGGQSRRDAAKDRKTYQEYKEQNPCPRC